ncbi:phage major capsid protein [Streptomyces lycii]|uniref:Phage major capsid protein n=1 Tax=Streptomyces lycii TaxID=2654337 RepID=A0ABQ7FJW8_9ACTN|nr:phage major capsid protein [Streptomyces lycii]KAF4408659.1 phage major capsid protein [Streptomyces lycii]
MDLTHGQAVIRLKDIRAALEDLESRDELTGEDEQSFDELTREFAEVDQHRRQLERKSALEKVRSAVKATDRGPSSLRVERGAPSADTYDADPILNPDSVEECRFRNPWDVSEIRQFGRSRDELGAEYRARALSAVEKMTGASDGVRSAATKIIERHDDASGSIARMALATSSPEYLRAWSKLASGRGHMVSPDEQRALERALSLTDSAGGYLVPFQLDPTVVITSDGSANQIRQAARSVVASGDVWNGVSAGAVTWSWAAEAAQATDDSPTFAQPSINIHKAHGFVPISIEALEDAANVTAEVGRLLAFGKDSLEANAFISGTGTGQPQGLITALDAAGAGVVVNSTAANAVAAADVYALDSDLPARFRGNASFLANRSTYNEVRALGEGGGSDMWERIGNGMPSQLLGRPAYEAEAMAVGTTTTTDGTTGLEGQRSDSVLVFGDFHHYVIADRVGMQVEFINHLFGAAQRPTGQRGWYTYYRVGAGVTNAGAFRQLKA